MLSGSIVERRAEERRKPGLRTFARALYGGRRRHARRIPEHSSNVDHPPAPAALAGLLLLLLSLADAMLTVHLIDAGAVEINPLMAMLMSTSLALFAGTKIGLTGLGLLPLLMYGHCRVFGQLRCAQMLWLVLLAYASLVSYQLGLLQQVN